MTRSRIDVILVDRGLFPSREQARAALLAGEVRVSDQVVTKAGQLVDETAQIKVAERPRFVSRGERSLPARSIPSRSTSLVFASSM